jgi:hypothetical protein
MPRQRVHWPDLEERFGVSRSSLLTQRRTALIWRPEERFPHQTFAAHTAIARYAEDEDARSILAGQRISGTQARRRLHVVFAGRTNPAAIGSSTSEHP